MSTCVCGKVFTLDHAMICKRGGYVEQRHNELRDLDPELLGAVCRDIESEPFTQDTSKEQLNRGFNKAQGWLFLHVDSADTNDRHSLMSGFSNKSRKSPRPQNIYSMYENGKKRQYSMRVLDIK